MRCQRPTNSSTISGFTLIEFVVALVIIGIGAAVLTSFVTPTASSADPMLQAQARAIATGYMDEILLRKHDQDPGDCTGGRGSWASIHCYDVINNESPTDQFGNPIASLGSYQVTVNVSGSAPADISVNVTHNSSGATATLRSQRGSY